MRALVDDVIEKAVPAFADLLEGTSRYNEAEIGNILLDHLEPGITAGEESDFDGALDSLPL